MPASSSLDRADSLTPGISDVISSSAPSLPPPVPVPPGAMPLPPGGLPEGWTMDQWVAYGHLWYEQNT